MAENLFSPHAHSVGAFTILTESPRTAGAAPASLVGARGAVIAESAALNLIKGILVSANLHGGKQCEIDSMIKK